MTVLPSSIALALLSFLLQSYMCAKGKAAARLEIPKSQHLDIVKVLNTSRRLWVYKRTQTNTFTINETYVQLEIEETCIFNKKINISSTDYYFWQKMSVVGETVELPLLGKFVENETEPPNAMDVWDLSENDSSPFQRMTLNYTERGCSIFILTPLQEDGEEECEMYIRNSNRSISPPHRCNEVFKRICKASVYEPYKPSCKAE
uniref:Putative salivary lipocalin n=1 Tax=Amblyomma tuberculatum TaxID=48802 RepID=A0A6M2E4U0_9ACAR